MCSGRSSHSLLCVSLGPTLCCSRCCTWSTCVSSLHASSWSAAMKQVDRIHWLKFCLITHGHHPHRHCSIFKIQTLKWTSSLMSYDPKATIVYCMFYKNKEIRTDFLHFWAQINSFLHLSFLVTWIFVTYSALYNTLGAIPQSETS